MSDEQSGQRPPELMEFWRQWLTESERQFNAFFNTAMNTDAFGRTAGGYMEMYAGFQRMLAEGMQRYLSFINMPSRTDVIGLGETLRVIDARLARIEETLQIAAEVSGPDRGPAPVREPARTRRPTEAPPLEAWEEAARIPEQFRAEPPAFALGRAAEDQPPAFALGRAAEDQPPAFALGRATEDQPPAFALGRATEDQPPAFTLGRATGDEPLALERLRGLEERLARIEETLRIAMELVDTGEAGSAEAAATPDTISRDEKNGAASPAVPEELRR